MTEIALFPIPNCVSFPGTIYPLHVFEPRFRAMVKHCIETGTFMAVCHTQKEVRPAKSQQTVEEALQSNQATYKPFDVFSAGPCELMQELDDGRMLIHVYLKKRFQAVQELQTIPFSIYQCEEVLDDPLTAEEAEEAALLKEKILNRLVVITAPKPKVKALLQSAEWQEKSPEDFSFELFGILQLDADSQQQVLELRSPLLRLERALWALNQVGRA